MSEASGNDEETVNLDEIEAQLAEVELLLERLDKPNG